MDQNNSMPTKANLIRAKQTLSLAKQGYNLLDQKQNALTRELQTQKEQAAKQNIILKKSIQEAKTALIQANINMGHEKVKNFANTTPTDSGIQIKLQSIMGVAIPTCHHKQSPLQAPPNLITTSPSLDKAHHHFNELKSLLIIAATTQSKIQHLQSAIKKTQKQSNALQHIIIPKYEAQIKSFTSIFEEQERDAFIRLKIIGQSLGEDLGALPQTPQTFEKV